MAPVRAKKRVSDPKRANVATPTKTDPGKRRVGITLAQKMVLIENLQLELAERARRLRAQYNLQAQGLRTRVEIRINRIPTSLRRLKMGDLLAKYQAMDPTNRAVSVSKPPPPVPAKDYPPRAASPQKTLFGPLLPGATAKAATKRKSDHISQEKENVTSHPRPFKRMRTEAAKSATASNETTILSPTSLNARRGPRPQPVPSPKRPASPAKSAYFPTTTSSSRAAANAKKAKSIRTGTRKADAPTTATITGVNSSSTARTTVRKATAPVPAPVQSQQQQQQPKRLSESSEASNGDGKRAPSRTDSAAPPSPTKRTVMSTIRKGVAGATAKKVAASKATASAGRALRRRG